MSTTNTGIHFNDLLRGLNLQIEDFKYYRHSDSKDYPNVLNMFTIEHERFLDYQNDQDKDLFNKKYLASFIQSQTGETLFAGIYEVKGHEVVNGRHKYKTELTPYLSELSNRLIISWPKGNAGRKPDRVPENFNEKVICIKEPLHDDFPGYFEFYYNVDNIKTIPKLWQSYLSKAKGVYLLTCTKNRQHQYVGKADGEDGFFGRWCHYKKADDGSQGTGGNKLLLEHAKNCGSPMEVTILETTTWADSKIYEKEQFWMKKLHTKEANNGLNAN